MHEYWHDFNELGKKNQEDQAATLKSIFPEGKSIVLTFAPSDEIYPEGRGDFLALMAVHRELNSRLVKKFQYGNEDIYEVYEVARSSN